MAWYELASLALGAVAILPLFAVGITATVVLLVDIAQFWRDLCRGKL